MVSVPDHEGAAGVWVPLRARLSRAGRPARDTRQPPFRPRPDADGSLGLLGGGSGNAWAVEMQAEYAPELNIAGAVLGSPVGDLGNTFRRLNGTPFSALPALVVAALMKTYPDLRRVHRAPRHVRGTRFTQTAGG